MGIEEGVGEQDGPAQEDISIKTFHQNKYSSQTYLGYIKQHGNQTTIIEF